MSDEAAPKKFRVDTSVNIGTIIQSIIFVLPIIWLFAGKSVQGDKSVEDLKAFRQQYSDEQKNFRNDVTNAFSDVKLQIANLPTDRAAAAQLDRRIVELNQALSQHDARISTLEQGFYRIKSDLDNLKSASSVGLRRP